MSSPSKVYPFVELLDNITETRYMFTTADIIAEWERLGKPYLSWPIEEYSIWLEEADGHLDELKQATQLFVTVWDQPLQMVYWINADTLNF